MLLQYIYTIGVHSDVSNSCRQMLNALMTANIRFVWLSQLVTYFMRLVCQHGLMFTAQATNDQSLWVLALYCDELRGTSKFEN